MSHSDVDDNSSEDENFQSEEIKKKVYDVMKTFDEDGDEHLEAAEVAACLRVLGFSPSQNDLEILFEQLTKSDELYAFEVIHARVLVAMENGEWPRDPDSVVEKAFEIIARDRQLTRDVLVKDLTTLGEPLSESEVKQLLSHLATRRNGQIDWNAHLRDVLRFVQTFE